MREFSHTDLDGVYARLIGRAILECRDPNDGQSSDPHSKSRHQYTLVNGVLVSRVLPPESVGDRWRGADGRLERRPPAWESIDVPRQWSLLMAWGDHACGDYPRPWSMGGSAAYGERIELPPPPPPVVYRGTHAACSAYIAAAGERDLGLRRGSALREWEVVSYGRAAEPHYAPVRMVWLRSRIEITGLGWPQQLACPHCQDWIVWAEAGYVPGYRICRGCHRHWLITTDSGVSRGWTLRRTQGRGWPYSEGRS